MDEEEVLIAVAFPVDPAKRAEARAMANGMIPATVPGSIKMPCSGCAMELWVGPRVQNALVGGVKLMCPWCMADHLRLHERIFGPTEFNITSLGNPDSKLEE